MLDHLDVADSLLPGNDRGREVCSCSGGGGVLPADLTVKDHGEGHASNLHREERTLLIPMVCAEAS